MTSKLVLDNLAGRTTAGSIAVVAEGNGTTTNLQQGLAKAWASIYHNSGTPTTKDAFNIASYTDSGTGNIKPNLTSAMANTGYTVTSAGWGIASWLDRDTGAMFSSTSQYQIYNTENNGAIDVTSTYPISTTVHGDLA